MSETSSKVRREYPRTIKLRDGVECNLRLMTGDDVERMTGFGRELPEEDLLFLRVDITDPAIVKRWVDNQSATRTVTLIAETSDGAMAGYGSLSYNEISWQRHLGEIRLLASRGHRSRGLGRALALELYHVARDLGLRKIVAQMTSDQKSAIATFERHGFQAEALLQDFVIDRTGRTRDLVVMAHDVEGLTDRVD
jgi:L-amino acid N-acyltransferase YncA